MMDITLPVTFLKTCLCRTGQRMVRPHFGQKERDHEGEHHGEFDEASLPGGRLELRSRFHLLLFHSVLTVENSKTWADAREQERGFESEKLKQKRKRERGKEREKNERC